MHRTLAFVAAVALTTLSVTTACFANLSDGIRFTLEPGSTADRVQLDLSSGTGGRDNRMSSSFAATELAGLDVARLRSATSGPIRFALVREAGRVDCAGNAARGRAEGSCRFTENRAFADLLATRGMARPTREQAYGLTMIGATRGLLDALHAQRYPMPSVGDYIAMTAVGVTPRYVQELAAAGYRPDHSKRLIELAALKIDPEFIRGFERIGYRSLPAQELVELKALNVTPEFALAVRRSGARDLSVDQLVKLKAIGFKPGRSR